MEQNPAFGSSSEETESKSQVTQASLEYVVTPFTDDKDEQAVLEKWAGDAKGTDITLDEFRDLFYKNMHKIDTDRDGFVSDDELLAQLNNGTMQGKEKTMVRALWHHEDILPGYSIDTTKGASDAKAEAERGFTWKDVQGLHKDADNWMNLYKAFDKTIQAKGTIDFSELDVNKDGLINKDELQHQVGDNRSPWRSTVSKHALNHIKDVAASNFDGKIWDESDPTPKDFQIYFNKTGPEKIELMNGLIGSLRGDLQEFADKLKNSALKHFPNMNYDGDSNTFVTRAELRMALTNSNLPPEARVAARFLHDKYYLLNTGDRGVSQKDIRSLFDSLDAAHIRTREPSERVFKQLNRDSVARGLNILAAHILSQREWREKREESNKK